MPSFHNPFVPWLAGALQVLYGLTHDYTLSVILLTLIVKAVIHPLTRVQLRSMKAMQVLTPHMAELRRKHKDDPKTLNQEMMALYRAHSVNPMMGCLPMVVQLPVLWGLFALLSNSKLFGNATVIGLPWLGMAERPMGRVLQALPNHPVFLLALIFPVLVGLTTWYQQKMSMTDPAQAKMFVFMPIMFGYFALNYAAGLSIYWIVSTTAYIGEYFLVVGRPHPMVSAPPKSQAIAQSRAAAALADSPPAAVKPQPAQAGGKSANRRGRRPRNQKGAKQA
ncbi:MAG TPA: YidC/Oxa1 family membrane protein insertase [bacterium]|nr:YidC/Oxa1 family membrane protein insertase [bacterium]